MEDGQELPVALALVALVRSEMQPTMRPDELERMLVLIDGARTAMEQFVDRLDPDEGTEIYSRAARFVERFQRGLDRLRNDPPSS